MTHLLIKSLLLACLACSAAQANAGPVSASAPDKTWKASDDDSKGKPKDEAKNESKGEGKNKPKDPSDDGSSSEFPSLVDDKVGPEDTLNLVEVGDTVTPPIPEEADHNVPEPSSVALIAAAMVCLGYVQRRRSRKAD